MTATFFSAARSFAQLVREIPAAAWDGPGLGEWDLRALVGHTSRSLITVSTYLKTTAEREDITTPAEYYVRVTPTALGISPADVAERGRQAGRDLGADPAATIDALASRVFDEVADAGNPLIEVLGGLGIRLHNYLPTRTFELAVHSLDIAEAVGIRHVLPPDVLDEALLLGMRTAVETGHGETVLLALTGRAPLPPSFSVV
ncbi:maleylpyruvate isomerase N-terminal domain-containing protein [Mycobacterium deserti]|uniref:Maleylpyruvate isomerase N-terminal domain-containing protein n=1 Tax=Mycobacterium deserti TaxID=2978347 RepID=A0ABT2M5M5_9MYCO|nr:maleylpyruvate isomerase N-terminal domain-containing protein [Mycobacterium deserti]MCT7657560.1 maleylpyruvate isomerase N-terminal domain-containing protein [Mycobacterium deserti]